MRFFFALSFVLSSSFWTTITSTTGFASAASSIVKEEEKSAETLFRETVAIWQSSRSSNNWSPWVNFGQAVWQHFETTTSATKKLEWVGALEEGILAIERTVFQDGNGADAVRDATLSVLYTKYAQVLTSLSPELCRRLALDPHTLLIGAETVKTGDETPSDTTTTICLENAENSLRNAITLDATNKDAEKLLEELLGDAGSSGSVHQRKPKEFVAELFDSFADTFDEKLVQGLQYRVPQMVGELAAKLLLLRKDNNNNKSDNYYYSTILDAGCGTGLAGRYLRSLLPSSSGDGILVGVDASQKMLDKAKECTFDSGGCGASIEKTTTTTKEKKNSPPLYDSLLQLDLDDMTLDNTLLLHQDDENTPRRGFDLIVAADVLVYFGSLEHVLNTFAKLSSTTTDESYLIFSCELATPQEAPLGFRLLPSGRFAHTKQHAIDMATKNAEGYSTTLVHYEEIVPRMEKGEPVKGHLFGFRLNRRGASRSDIEEPEL